MKYIKRLWNNVVDLVINFLALIGVCQLIIYNADYWIIYLSFISVIYYTILRLIKRYKELFNDG